MVPDNSCYRKSDKIHWYKQKPFEIYEMGQKESWTEYIYNRFFYGSQFKTGDDNH